VDVIPEQVDPPLLFLFDFGLLGVFTPKDKQWQENQNV
jgi:hypothetical protein